MFIRSALIVESAREGDASAAFTLGFTPKL
jgi:hypothetical protein